MFLGFGFKNPPFFLLKTVDNEKCMSLPSSWLMLYIVEWQFCCSSEGPKGLGHEYCADWFTRHTAHHLRAWFVWYVPWLVRVLLHADHLFSKLTKRFVSLVLDIILSFWYIILVKLRNWNQLMWLVQQENNNNDFHSLSLTCFFDMYK